MKLNPARFLLRCDDLCPGMPSDRRERFLSLLARHEIKPILAVVPDNQDPDLQRQEPDPAFWDRMRACQDAGATIAMHGYRHLCASRGKSMLSLNRESEFAGIDEAQQRQWIRCGLEILRGHGLNPRLFVAPRHGFDRATLRALSAEGLGVISDGFACRPFTRHGVLWIPQQLWEPVQQTTGLWTICIHPNTATPTLESQLSRFLKVHGSQVTSFDKVIADYTGKGGGKDLDWGERLGEFIALRRVRFSAAKTFLFPDR